MSLNFLKPQENYLSFLREDVENTSSFFSKQGLEADIIEVTCAEPDIPLQVFYALNEILLPVIRLQQDISLQDAWNAFLGGSQTRGILTPPENLIIQKRVSDILEVWSNELGEEELFQKFDEVGRGITRLKAQLPKILSKDIFDCLTLVEKFYEDKKNAIKAILEQSANGVSNREIIKNLEDIIEPKSVMFASIFQNHWAYRIQRKFARRMISLDEEGKNLKGSSKEAATHRVSTLPIKEAPKIFFKANGHPQLQPQKEYMLYSLYKLLMIPIPNTDLLVLSNVFDKDPDNFYTVQASEAVSGTSPQERIDNLEIDQGSFSQQVIGALLTNPSDGKLQNFIYNPEFKTFISIDNDQVFEKELQVTGDMHIKSFLFTLSLMEKFVPPDSVKIFFRTLDPEFTLFSWLRNLCIKNKEYPALEKKLSFQNARLKFIAVSPSEEIPPINNLLQRKPEVDKHLFSEIPCFSSITISKDLVQNLCKRLELLQNMLRRKKFPTLSDISCELSPILGFYYCKLRKLFKDHRTAVDILYGKNQDDKNYSKIDTLISKDDLNEIQKNYYTFKEEDFKEQTPEDLCLEYKTLLLKKNSLDSLVERHGERIINGLFLPEEIIAELELLKKEGLTQFLSARKVIDFWYTSRIRKELEDSNFPNKFDKLIESLEIPELKWLLTLEKHFIRVEEHMKKEKSFSCIVQGAFMKERMLVASLQEHILDEKDNFKGNPNLSGRSEVANYPAQTPLFYLKKYPEFPGYEYASTLFMKHLGVCHLPFQDLLIMKFKKDHFPVFLTSAVEGQAVYKVWHNDNVFKNLDLFHTMLQIISAIIINPEDGKEDNFILTPDMKYLIPIDNDHVFLPGTTHDKGNFFNGFTINTNLQTKTLLFCLDEMKKPIPPSVREKIISIDIDKFLQRWMHELVDVENRFQNLITDPDIIKKFLDHGTIMEISFCVPFIEHMYWKFQKIKSDLQSSQNLTPFDLLKVVEPFAAKRYQESFALGKTLKERFTIVTEKLYPKASGGVRQSVINSKEMMRVLEVTEEDLQTKLMFKKRGPSHFLDVLSKLSQDYQSGKENEAFLFEFEDDNESKLWGLSSFEKKLRDFFLDPKEALSIKNSSRITTLNMYSFFDLSFKRGITIKYLSILNSPTLTVEVIQIIIHECPNLEYLNVSGCMNLTKIEAKKGDWRSLIRLKAKKCSQLSKVSVDNDIKVIQVESSKSQIVIEAKNSIFEDLNINIQVPGWRFVYNKSKSLEIKTSTKVLDKGEIFLNLTLIESVFVFNIGGHSIEKLIGFLILNKKDDLTRIDEYLKALKRVLGWFDHKKLFPEGNRARIKPLYLQELQKCDLNGFIVGEEEVKILTEELQLIHLEILSFPGNCRNDKIMNLLIKANWPNLKVVDLSKNKILDEGIKSIVKANWLQLEQLNLCCTGLTKDGIETLSKDNNWPNLKVIDLSNNKISDAGLESLVQANWSQLERLNLCCTRITTDGMKILSKDHNCTNLKVIDLSNNKIYDEGIKSFVLANWSQLEQLNLRSTGITADGIITLSKGNNWLDFKVLDLSDNKIYNKGIESLVKANWSKLERLNLCCTGITTDGMKILSKYYNWPNLKVIDLSKNSILDEGIKSIVKADWLQLEQLNLCCTGLTKNGIETLSKDNNWPNLKMLDLSICNIYNEGIKSLVQANWSQLEQLNLDSTGITTDGMKILSKHNWPNLKKLDLNWNIISDEGIKLLISRNLNTVISNFQE